jgi:hypothetical protein
VTVLAAASAPRIPPLRIGRRPPVQGLDLPFGFGGLGFCLLGPLARDGRLGPQVHDGRLCPLG